MAADRRTWHPAALPMRWKVALATMLLTTAVVASVGSVAEQSTRRALTSELTARLQVQASHLALASSPALLAPYPELTLHPVLRQLRGRQQELALAVVADRSGIVVGEAEPRLLGQRFVLPAGLVSLRTDGLYRGTLAQSPSLLLASVPVIEPGGARLGTAYLALRRSYVEDAVQAARRPLVAMTSLFLIAGLLGSLLVASTLLRPIARLRVGLERIGHGDLDTRLDLDPRTELGRLATTVNRMAEGLKQAQVEALEKERLSHEMKLAQRIQRSLLPTERLLEGEFAVVGAQRQATEVGGDFYDVFRLEDGRIGVAVADVAGKGLGACLITMMLAALFAAVRGNSSRPSTVLTALDDGLSERLERGSFVTMFLAYLDPRSGILTYASAGHHPALLIRADGRTEWLRSPGIPIGVDRRHGIAATIEDRDAILEPGDLLLQSTDGIHESEHPGSGEAFGFDRLARTVVAALPGGAAAVVEAVSEAVRRWSESEALGDDQTLVVLHREPARPAGEDPFLDPRERLQEARARGIPLKLPATFDALVRLDDWMGRIPALARLGTDEREPIRLSLYELCANVIEHGYRGKPGVPIELWWVPRPEAEVSGNGGGAGGYFLMLDQGVPFSAESRALPDLEDQAVRRSRRGLGLEIVGRATSRLVNHPATPVGNITLISFDRAADARSMGARA